jgi:protein-L-isoaspartate(D-aspartate) O-methyltransferase
MKPSADTNKDQQLRSVLVEGIRRKGITDELVLRAIESIPRHFFMDEYFHDVAYEDKAFPIGQGQTISQPYTVAYQTQLLQVEPGDKVLEIGTGSAYQAMVLAMMGAEVFTIERQRKLYESNQHFDFLQRMEHIHFYYGDGYEGLPGEAPFDKILITAAAPIIPPALVEQLKPGGVMVLPKGDDRVQKMIRITKLENGGIKKETCNHFSFVPMLKGTTSHDDGER